MGQDKNIWGSISNPKTEIIDLVQSATQNTWYTILDTSETGFLKLVRVLWAATGTNGAIEIKITLDGNAKTYSLSTSNNAANSNETTNTLEIPFNDRYGSTIKIEMRHTAATTNNLSGYAVRRSYQ